MFQRVKKRKIQRRKEKRKRGVTSRSGPREPLFQADRRKDRRRRRNRREREREKINGRKIRKRLFGCIGTDLCD